MTGEKLETAEVMIHNGYTRMALTLKLETSGKPYVVLANLSAGNSQYSLFEPVEFDQFVEAALKIQSSLRHLDRTASQTSP